MAGTTSDAFLQGQGIPVDPQQIEDELVKLWGPAAKEAHGTDDDHPTVTRVVLANLVVGSRMSDSARIDGVLDTVVARYPCRAIVLRQTDDTERKVTAEVSALCHLPAPGMPQVCSERIVLRAGPKGLDLLPGSVRSLLEPDMPFVLWWTFDPRESEAIYYDLGDECSRLILDLPDPDTDVEALRVGLNLDRVPYVRDTSWFGISRWRELVAQFFDAPGCRGSLHDLTAVDIQACEPSGQKTPRVAAWLAGWLAGQLGWQPLERKQTSPGALEAIFQGPKGNITVAIDTHADPAAKLAILTSTTLTAHDADGEHTFRIERPKPGAQEVKVESHSPHTCAMPRLLHATTFDAPRRIATGLESSRIDPPFSRALPHMLWLLGA